MKKIFSKEKYIEIEGARSYYSWVDKADGHEIDEHGRIKGTPFGAVDAWCIEVEEKEKKAKMTIQDFKGRNIAVVIKSKPDLKKFLAMCDEAGLQWFGGDKASDWEPPFCNKCVLSYGMVNDTITYSSDSKNGGMSGRLEEVAGYTLVDVSEFFGNIEKAHNEYRIVITCKDGKTTRAQMIVNGKTVKGAEAHCNPADKFSIATGVKLAVNRLFGKKEKEDIPFTEILF